MVMVKQVIEFIPTNNQESQDKEIITNYIKQFCDNILLRDNKFKY